MQNLLKCKVLGAVIICLLTATVVQPLPAVAAPTPVGRAVALADSNATLANLRQNGDWYRRLYEDTGSEIYAKSAVAIYTSYMHALAEEGRIDAFAQRFVAERLAEDGNRTQLDRVFRPILAHLPENYWVALDYAYALGQLGSPDAERWFETALKLRPTMSIVGITEYARWLLKQGRPEDALSVLERVRPGEERFEVVHFYKGLALEQVGQEEEATREYSAYKTFNQSFPAPKEFETPLGKSIGLRYDGDVIVQDTCGDAKLLLSRMIYCEARGESSGGKTAVGWVARNRVFVSGPSGCNERPSSGTYCERYITVLNDGFCISSSHNEDTDAAANLVFNGSVPDPVARRCVAGSNLTGDWCEGLCSQQTTQGGISNGGYFFYSTSGSCASTHPSGCGYNKGKVCGDGGSDHCFYAVW